MPDVAVVTGASRGIGRACALALADRGLELGLLGRQSLALQDVCRLIAEHGSRAQVFSCDMADEARVSRAARAVLGQLGTPRLVVNNAAELQTDVPVHQIAVEDWDRILAVNLRGPFLLCRALLPAMLEARRGRFVQVASISATLACPNMAHYGASKWGLLGLSKSLAEELRGTGLQSVAVLPGSVDTEMLRATAFEPAMSATEVAELIVYYGLDAPDAVNGAAVELLG